jgi:hypothetical protein
VASEDNPFQQVYCALWELAEQNDFLRTAIKPNNRIKFEDAQGIKRNRSNADTPEVTLVQTDITANLKISSSQTSAEKSYIWIVSSGSLRLEQFNCITWELFRAMVNYDTVLCALEWTPDPDSIVPLGFVQKVQPLDSTETIDVTEFSRGIREWSALMGFTVNMIFPTQFLRNL